MNQVKQCSICKENKSLSKFYKNKTKKDGLQTVCKKCDRAGNRNRIAEDPIKHRARVAKRKKKLRGEARVFIFNYFIDNPCVDCGETDPVLLEFDHLKDKKHNVSTMVSDGYLLTEIKKEIAKCEIRCVKCHRLKTARVRNYWTWQMSRKSGKTRLARVPTG